MVVGLSALSYRLLDLHVFHPNAGRGQAGEARTVEVCLPAARGLLVDCNEEVLAGNLLQADVKVDRYQFDDPKIAVYCLACDRARWEQNQRARMSAEAGSPVQIPAWDDLPAEKQTRKISEIRKRILDEFENDGTKVVELARQYVVKRLAKPLGLSEEKMMELLLDKKRKDVLLVKDMPGDIAKRIEKIVAGDWIQGVRFEWSFHRWYPMPELAVHVLGFADDSYQGKCGVEAAMNSYLQGRDGLRILKRDSYGLLKPAYEGHLREPSDGLNVQLTLDMGIQRIAEEELDWGLGEFIAKRGTVIIIEPRCGGILAMVSRPNYNLNRRERINEASLNFATQAIYEPGSTFKIIAVSGALNAGVVRPSTTIDCHQGYFQEGAIVVHDHHPYGWLSVEEVIEKSSNIGAYMIARRLGKRRFFEMGRKLGFGRETGIRLSGESSGVFRDTGNAVDFSRVAYGYAANVTPLQVACAYAAIANGGRLMRPRIVSRVVSNDGRMIEQINPEMISRAMRPNTAARVRKALEMVVSDKGTARRAKVPGYRVGGKTGTARKHKPGGGYIKGHYTVSFAGIMPIDNPAFVCVVVVDDPRIDPAITPHYGGTIAAPIFARIAERVVKYLKIPPSEPIPDSDEAEGLAENPSKKTR